MPWSFIGRVASDEESVIFPVAEHLYDGNVIQILSSCRITIVYRQCPCLTIGAARTKGATPAAAPMKTFAGRKPDRANPVAPARISHFLAPVRTAIPCPPRAYRKCHVERSGSTNAASAETACGLCLARRMKTNEVQSNICIQMIQILRRYLLLRMTNCEFRVYARQEYFEWIVPSKSRIKPPQGIDSECTIQNSEFTIDSRYGGLTLAMARQCSNKFGIALGLHFTTASRRFR